MSKDLVAEGICYLGYTDTDDAFAAIDEGAPVEMLPVRIDNGATICLPNSAAMIARLFCTQCCPGTLRLYEISWPS